MGNGSIIKAPRSSTYRCLLFAYKEPLTQFLHLNAFIFGARKDTEKCLSWCLKKQIPTSLEAHCHPYYQMQKQAVHAP
jgi:hypothetical protein